MNVLVVAAERHVGLAQTDGVLASTDLIELLCRQEEEEEEKGTERAMSESGTRTRRIFRHLSFFLSSSTLSSSSCSSSTSSTSTLS